VVSAPAWLSRWTDWLEEFAPAFSAHAAQRGGLRRYVEGVLSDSRRKSMEAMWARLRDPGSYQALQYFITEADWRADRVWRLLRAAIPARSGVLVLDGTGFPKQGSASVGVAREYSGTLGKIGNCQVAVTGALWTGIQAWCVGALLYLPQSWLTPALTPASRPTGQRGRPASRPTLAPDVAPGTLRELAKTVPVRAWRTVSWRNGTHAPWRAGFWTCRVTPAHDWRRRVVAPEIWLLCQRDLGATPETKYYFVHLPATASLKAVVRLAHQRWAIEQQYAELKDELGLDHFEGRSCHGWHRHVVLTASAYAFLQRERLRPRRHTLTFPQARAVITDILTAHYFLTHRRQLKMLLELAEMPLRI